MVGIRTYIRTWDPRNNQQEWHPLNRDHFRKRYVNCITGARVSQLTGLHPISQPVCGISCTWGHRHRTFCTPHL